MTGVISFLREFEPPVEIGAEGSARSKEQAFQAGVAEGRAQARAEADAELSAALTQMKQAFVTTAAAREEVLESIRTESNAAVAGVIRAICPKLAERGLYDAVHQVMSDAVLDAQGPVSVGAAPGIAGALCERLRREVALPFETCERPDLSGGRVEINWNGGGAEIDVGAIASRILELADGLDGGLTKEKEGTDT